MPRAAPTGARKIHAGRCERCAGTASQRVCGTCGSEKHARAACYVCSLRAAILELRADADREAVAALDGYLTALETARPANSVLVWLSSPTSAASILRELLAGTRAITHAALDDVPATYAVTFLRTALVRHGVLPARDEVSHRFALWIEATTKANLPDHPDRSALRRWATWHVLHDLRAREREANAPISDKHPRTLVRVADHFIRWIHDHDLTLVTTHQEHLDAWLAHGNSKSRYVKTFLSWAQRAGLTPHLTVTETRPAEHRTGTLADSARVTLLRRLLDHDTIESRIRVPALLILLYGQPLARVARMRTNQITTTNGITTIRLGIEHIVLPDPIDQILLDFIARPRNRTLHDRSDSPWLLPGMKAGAPIEPEGLRRRLRTQLPEMTIRPSRNSAVMTLLRDVPPPILADVLGFSQGRAHRWAELAAISHAGYVAARLDAETRPPSQKGS